MKKEKQPETMTNIAFRTEVNSKIKFKKLLNKLHSRGLIESPNQSVFLKIALAERLKSFGVKIKL
tara:strand:+ start:4531 stop:4725 length:195 start_codon:yes stop_codon:yes gene_type:complete